MDEMRSECDEHARVYDSMKRTLDALAQKMLYYSAVKKSLQI